MMLKKSDVPHLRYLKKQGGCWVGAEVAGRIGDALGVMMQTERVRGERPWSEPMGDDWNKPEFQAKIDQAIKEAME